MRNADPIEQALVAIVLANPSPIVIKLDPKAIFASVIKFSPSSKSLTALLLPDSP